MPLRPCREPRPSASSHVRVSGGWSGYGSPSAPSGKTQAEIARRAGLPEETVSRVVRGDSVNPRLETIICIMHAIGGTVGWLLEERGYAISVEQVRRLRDPGVVIAEVAGA